jgi:iron complex outermembrane recepter protein
VNNFNNLSDAALPFVDGMPVSNGNLPGTLDIESVEVPKGSQSAYFGRNTSSGAISATTRNPSETRGGRVGAEYANYSNSGGVL